MHASACCCCCCTWCRYCSCCLRTFVASALDGVPTPKSSKILISNIRAAVAKGTPAACLPPIGDRNSPPVKTRTRKGVGRHSTQQILLNLDDYGSKLKGGVIAFSSNKYEFHLTIPMMTRTGRLPTSSNQSIIEGPKAIRPQPTTSVNPIAQNLCCRPTAPSPRCSWPSSFFAALRAENRPMSVTPSNNRGTPPTPTADQNATATFSFSHIDLLPRPHWSERNRAII